MYFKGHNYKGIFISDIFPKVGDKPESIIKGVAGWILDLYSISLLLQRN